LEYSGLQDNIVNGEVKTVISLLNVLHAFGHFVNNDDDDGDNTLSLVLKSS
jgi:hypothetical protein